MDYSYCYYTVMFNLFGVPYHDIQYCSWNRIETYHIKVNKCIHDVLLYLVLMVVMMMMMLLI